MSCKPVMLSLPHYLGSSLPWPTFIILSLEGLYLLQRRLAVIVFYTIIYSVCVCVCFHLRKRQPVCVCDKETAGSIDSHGLRDLLPSPFSGAITSLAVKFFVKRPDSRADVCVCLCRVCMSGCVWSVFAYLPLCRYQSVGASWGDCRRHYLGDVHDHQPGGQQVRDRHWGGAVCFRLLSFNLSAHHTASPVPLPATSSPPLFAEHAAQTCTPIVSSREHTVTCTVHVQYRCRHIPTQHGTIAHLVETTGEDICVTNAMAAVDRLHYCLKQQSQPRTMHSTTLAACFVFVDITVTISLSIVTGWSGENCEVMMIDIDLV